ncbi:MAG TPA: hypothetical protein VF753_21040 [Terriglobales bacterium]
MFKLGVEVGERGMEHFPVARMLGRFELLENSAARKLEGLALVE